MIYYEAEETYIFSTFVVSTESGPLVAACNHCLLDGQKRVTVYLIKVNYGAAVRSTRKVTKAAAAAAMSVIGLTTDRQWNYPMQLHCSPINGWTLANSKLGLFTSKLSASKVLILVFCFSGNFCLSCDCFDYVSVV